MKGNKIQFWYYDKERTKINMTRIYKFLNQMGIWLVRINKSWFIVEEVDNVMEEVEEIYISQLIKNHVRSLELPSDERDSIEESLRNKNSRIIAKDQLMLLDTLDINFKRDTADTCFIYYNNEWLEITSNEVKSQLYSDLEGHIWKNKIIERSFNLLNLNRNELLENCVFTQFIWNVSSQNQKRFDSICSMIGYLLHEYKNPSENRAIVFMDEKISENPNGRTGKGIVMNAISKMREMVIQDGKNFTFSTRFAFQDVKHSTSVLIFDDVKRNFDTERLFSALTSGINVEQKGLQRFRIESEDSPKILINTNYVLKGDGASHLARRCEFEFSQHYNAVNTPVNEFGHLFFVDWDEEQWNLFDNFMIKCVQLFLEKNIIEADKINLEQKKIEAETCSEFVEFISEYRVNKKLCRNELRVKFDSQYPEISGEKWYTNRQFCKWIKVFAEFKGYKYEEFRHDGDSYFIFHEMNQEKSEEEQIIIDDVKTKLENKKIEAVPTNSEDNLTIMERMKQMKRKAVSASEVV